MGRGPLPGPQEVCINEETARRLTLKPGMTWSRIPKPSQVPAEAPLAAAKERDVVVARVRIREVLAEERGGRFSLAAEQASRLISTWTCAGLGIHGSSRKRKPAARANGGLFQRTASGVETAWRLSQITCGCGCIPRGYPIGIGPLFYRGTGRSVRIAGRIRNPVLTYLVNQIRHGERATPYSFVVAGAVPQDTPQGRVCINQWLADALAVAEGDTVDMSWYMPLPSGGFSERSGKAVIHKIVSMEAAAMERELAPHFPGLSDVNSCRDWDIGLPLEEAQLLNEANEAYWKAYGQTPKLLTSYETGSAWWGGLYGSVTAVRFVKDAATPEAVIRRLHDNLDPSDIGLVFTPVREEAFRAVEQAVNFGALFSGMSMFLIGAALLLLALLYAHGLQMRAAEMGALLASGWTLSRLRMWLFLESLPGCAAGALAGAAGGAFYARLLLFGLARFWPDVVAGTPVRYYDAPLSLLAQGALITAGCVVAVFTAVVLRAGRRPIRELLLRDFSGSARARGLTSSGVAALSASVLVLTGCIKRFTGIPAI